MGCLLVTVGVDGVKFSLSLLESLVVVFISFTLFFNFSLVFGNRHCSRLSGKQKTICGHVLKLRYAAMQKRVASNPIKTRCSFEKNIQ